MEDQNQPKKKKCHYAFRKVVRNEWNRGGTSRNVVHPQIIGENALKIH